MGPGSGAGYITILQLVYYSYYFLLEFGTFEFVRAAETQTLGSSLGALPGRSGSAPAARRAAITNTIFNQTERAMESDGNIRSENDYI